MKHSILFSVLLSISLIHASPIIDEEKIVGGSEVQGDLYSWEVSLAEMGNVPSTPEARKAVSNEKKLSAHFCGGVLIHKDWVLTAAHCVVKDNTKNTPMDPKIVGAGIGSKDLVELYNNGRIVASQVIIKDGYDATNQNTKEDFALVKLSKSADLTKVKVACLVKSEPKDTYPSPLTAIGWGNINVMTFNRMDGTWSGIQAPQKLKMATMDQVAYKDSYCNSRRDLICIMGKAKGDAACKGDSGGSLVSDDNRVIAITSFGSFDYVPGDKTKMKTCTGDAAYTLVSPNIEWIESKIGDKVCSK